MGRQILISVHELQLLLQQSQCIVFDCRFVLDDPDAGYESYLESHIPAAAYTHLDKDLASEITMTSGRHPLPDKDQFAMFLARSGWQPGQLLVAYDDAGGALAARMWWLMKYFGHDHAVLLDGGIPAWWAAGFELESGQPTFAAQPSISLEPDDGLVLSTTDVINALQQQQIVLADARAAERFAGKVEPIDKVAGHIPGAVNHPLNLNLNADGTFKTIEEIRAGLIATTGQPGAQALVHMCGSGVTACHNLFAAELVGLKGSRLYIGSWSEWIRDSSRPINTICP